MKKDRSISLGELCSWKHLGTTSAQSMPCGSVYKSVSELIANKSLQVLQRIYYKGEKKREQPERLTSKETSMRTEAMLAAFLASAGAKCTKILGIIKIDNVSFGQALLPE